MLDRAYRHNLTKYTQDLNTVDTFRDLAHLVSTVVMTILYYSGTLDIKDSSKRGQPLYKGHTNVPLT